MINKTFLNELIKNNVNIIDVNSTYISIDSKIGKNTIIYPNSFIEGCIVGENCIIKNNSTLINSKLENNIVIISSILENCTIKSNVNINGFCHLKNVTINKDCNLGCFCEIKNAILNKNINIASLCFLDNCQIGANSVLNSGVAISNYKQNKNLKTIIGENCFFGSNVNIVSPVIIGDDNYIYCGANIYKNIENNKFVMPKTELLIKPDYHN